MASSRCIGLEEFVASEIARVKRFKKHWRDMQKETRGTDEEIVWSEDGMTPGEWDEQLRLFDD